MSQQTRRRDRLRAWRAEVRRAAERYWPVGHAPFNGDLQVTIYYFFDGVPADVDNLVKPIHDAVIGLVYRDDRQVSESIVRRRDLRGRFHVRNLTSVLAEGLDRRREFLYVIVSDAPPEGALE